MHTLSLACLTRGQEVWKAAQGERVADEVREITGSQNTMNLLSHSEDFSLYSECDGYH